MRRILTPFRHASNWRAFAALRCSAFSLKSVAQCSRMAKQIALVMLLLLLPEAQIFYAFGQDGSAPASYPVGFPKAGADGCAPCQPLPNAVSEPLQQPDIITSQTPELVKPPIADKAEPPAEKLTIPATPSPKVQIPELKVGEHLRRRQQEREATYRKLQNRLLNAILQQQEKRAAEQARLRELEEQLNQQQPSTPDPGDQITTKSPEPKLQAVPSSPDVSPEQPSVAESSPPEADQSGVPLPNIKSQAGNPTTLPPVLPDTEPVAEDSKSPPSLFADAMNAKAIVDGPVNRIGLADNLYALGEFAIALEMYDQVVTKKQPASEVYWVMFQKASCHRRLQHREKAKEIYRRLAGQKAAGWLAKTSRWWLDQMDSRAALETVIEQQTKSVQLLKDSVLSENDETPTQ